MSADVVRALDDLESIYAGVLDVDADADGVIDAASCLAMLASVDASSLDESTRVELMKRTRALYARNRELLNLSNERLESLRGKLNSMGETRRAVRGYASEMQDGVGSRLAK